MTDGAGNFSLRAIAPGKYTIFAWQRPDHAGFHDAGVLKRVEQYGVSVDLKGLNSAWVELHVIAAGL